MQEGGVLCSRRIPYICICSPAVVSIVLTGSRHRCWKGFTVSRSSTNVNDLFNAEKSQRDLYGAVDVEKRLQERDVEIASLKLQLGQLKEAARQECGKVPQLHSKIPKIYAITPTHYRPVQKAELTRLSHTLMLVPNLHWVIVEDSETKTELVRNLIETTGLPFTHLNAATPKTWKHKSKDKWWTKPRGVLQRNTALEWLRANTSPDDEAVIYFADDDNSYSLQVFEEMRYVKRVGVWPVGLVGGLMVERPKVNEDGKVVGWLTVWSPDRPFAIDMAGFALNLQLFHSKPSGKFSFEAKKGFQESELLQQFVSSLDELEVKAANCTKVYVWHTRTEAPNLTQEEKLKKNEKPRSDLGIEV